MTDESNERTVEREGETDDEPEPVPADGPVDDRQGRPAVDGPGRTVDDAASGFLDVEATFVGGSSDDWTWGRAVAVERLPASAVPTDYPLDVGTDRTLALHLDVADRNATVYFEWDGEAAADGLGRLLALHGIPLDRFADLHGRRIPVRFEGDHAVPNIPDEFPRGSDSGVYGVIGVLVANLAVGVLVAAGLGSVLASVPVVLAWLVLNVVGVPLATYLDAWHLRTHTDWDGGPLFWAFLGAIPGVNVPASLLYLRVRRRARSLV